MTEVNYLNNRRVQAGTADEMEFTLEEREINGKIVLVKVYQNKYDKYKYNRKYNQVRPKTKNGGKC